MGESSLNSMHGIGITKGEGDAHPNEEKRLCWERRRKAIGGPWVVSESVIIGSLRAARLRWSAKKKGSTS